MVTKPEMEILLRQVDPVPDNLSDDVSAALLTSIVERRDTMTRTDLPSPAPARTPIPPARRRGWVAATAMAIVVVAIGAIAFLFAGPGDDTADPVTTPAVEATVPGTWTRTTLEPGFHARELRVTSFGLVAAAQTDGIWLNENGTGWRQVFSGPFEPYQGTTTTLTPPMTAPPPMPAVWSSVYGVAEFESTLYAFGGVVQNGTGQLVVWSSSDGIGWETTVIDESRPPTDGFVTSAVLATDDMIAAYEQGGSRIIHSRDGEVWTILEAAETGLQGVGLTDVAHFGDRFVAVGEVYPLGDVSHNGIRAIYRSNDGLRFEKLPGSDFGENSYPYELTSLDGVLFAAGAEFVPELGEPTAAVWYSSDGIEWQQMLLPESPQPGMSIAGTPISTDNQLYITVSARFYDDSSQLSVFATEDGAEVEQIPAAAAMLENVTEEVTGAFYNGRLMLLARGHCSLDCDPEPPLSQLTWTP